MPVRSAPDGPRGAWRDPADMTKKQIVIIGGGTGGTMAANRLRRRFAADAAEIHVVDGDNRHV
jgi:cation diffusion facilitator CzcD-associated flavoprotein CzcO